MVPAANRAGQFTSKLFAGRFKNIASPQTASRTLCQINPADDEENPCLPMHRMLHPLVSACAKWISRQVFAVAATARWKRLLPGREFLIRRVGKSCSHCVNAVTTFERSKTTTEHDYRTASCIHITLVRQMNSAACIHWPDTSPVFSTCLSKTQAPEKRWRPVRPTGALQSLHRTAPH